MAANTINGIPRAELQAQGMWKRKVYWTLGGPLLREKKGSPYGAVRGAGGAR